VMERGVGRELQPEEDDGGSLEFLRDLSAQVAGVLQQLREGCAMGRQEPTRTEL